MKGIFRLFTTSFLRAQSVPCLATVLTIAALASGCSKSNEKKDVASVAQDTMLMHDLAEANRNTAAANAADTTEAVVRARGGLGAGALLSGASSATEGTAEHSPVSRIPAPTRAKDASSPINVPGRMPSTSRSESASTSSNGDPCDSPNSADQRTCLNRSIVANDADLNRTYRDLLAQARTSGGPDLEQRFRQSQREWVDQRDIACRGEGDGALWARARAKCLAEHSDRRTAELQKSLNSLRGQ
ncbi:MAG: lysozyme inhibitor LprI family protein [Gemmatimonadaceae bacterium]